MTEVDTQNGHYFHGADGMHRCSAVVEIDEQRKAGAIKGDRCGDEVFAILLRPDTPTWVLLKISVGQSYPTPVSVSLCL